MLALWNDPQQVEAALELAERTLGERNDEEGRLVLAFRRVTSRAPSWEELAVLSDLLAHARSEYEGAELPAWAIVMGTMLASDAAVVLR